jgi:hypothetical protein
MRKQRRKLNKVILPFEDLPKHPAAGVKHYNFDEGLKEIFPQMTKKRREQLYRDFMRYAIRYDAAVHQRKPIETVPEPDVADVASQIEEDRRTRFSEVMLTDIQKWWEDEISRKRGVSGKKGGLARVRKRQRKKGIKFRLTDFS